jgi:hypothetical protein
MSTFYRTLELYSNIMPLAAMDRLLYNCTVLRARAHAYMTVEYGMPPLVAGGIGIPVVSG